MKALMMIPAGLIGLISFGHATGPVKPAANHIVQISDTTVPGGRSGHHMKGNSSDSSSTNGNWKGKGKMKHNQSGNSSGSSSGTGTGTTGTSSGGTGTGTNQ